MKKVTPSLVCSGTWILWGHFAEGLASLCGWMIPPGANDLDPDLNTVQTLVAVDEGGRWRISPVTVRIAALTCSPETSTGAVRSTSPSASRVSVVSPSRPVAKLRPRLRAT